MYIWSFQGYCITEQYRFPDMSLAIQSYPNPQNPGHNKSHEQYGQKMSKVKICQDGDHMELTWTAYFLSSQHNWIQLAERSMMGLSESPRDARPWGRQVTMAGRRFSSCLKRGITWRMFPPPKSWNPKRREQQSQNSSNNGEDLRISIQQSTSRSDAWIVANPPHLPDLDQFWRTEVISLVSTPLMSTMRQPGETPCRRHILSYKGDSGWQRVVTVESSGLLMATIYS